MSAAVPASVNGKINISLKFRNDGQILSIDSGSLDIGRASIPITGGQSGIGIEFDLTDPNNLANIKQIFNAGQQVQGSSNSNPNPQGQGSSNINQNSQVQGTPGGGSKKPRSGTKRKYTKRMFKAGKKKSNRKNILS